MSAREEIPFDKDSFRSKAHNIIFEANTFWGKFFDYTLLLFIVISIVVLMLESVNSINLKYGEIFFYIEWVLTILFTIEYLFRLYSVKKPARYATSFYGIVDLLAILPTFLEMIFAGSHFFLVIRVMRLLRVFRLFKAIRIVDESNMLIYSLKKSWPKISYFLFFILLTVCVIGTLMYLIEGSNSSSGFRNIPVSIYWCIVTLTTVGYGDISPITPLGQTLASVIMILGYSIIAVPTGIVTAQITRHDRDTEIQTEVCQYCSEENHLPGSNYCHNCGHSLHDEL
ncbi:ion transporter [Flavobacteriaceae bacterium Ap0902]|nr:ion transporter [Flavobacteriaceae bacterium Ap0902]